MDVSVHEGPVRFGRLTCPHCHGTERLIDVAARTNRPPEWRLFALEYLVPALGSSRRARPLAERTFMAASSEDQARYEAAMSELSGRTSHDGTVSYVPDYPITSAERHDDRLLRYGYTHYHQLFNSRQLLHLSLLGEAIDSLEGGEREALALAFSNHLTTNCMMTSYAFGWRRASPLFSVRAYRHIPRPVEINPWLDGTGRGTFPNAVRQIERAVAFARKPQEPLLTGGFKQVEVHDAAHATSGARIFHRNAQKLDVLRSCSVDLVLTDPPYFDNIAYSELSEFFLPWLQMFGLVSPSDRSPIALQESLAAKGRSALAITTFRQNLGQCFAEIARVLKPHGQLVFTYQHHEPGAWMALGESLATAGFRAVQVFPLLGDAWQGPHTYSGSSRWDAVFVMERSGLSDSQELVLTSETARAAQNHCDSWAGRLSQADGVPFRDVDARNFNRACLIAGALGMFRGAETLVERRPLREVLGSLKSLDHLSQEAEEIG
jgi:hypothetical protein